MQRLEVGRPHPLIRPGSPDAWYFSAGPGGLDLLIVMGSPRAREIEDYRKGGLDVGLVRAGAHSLLVLARAGGQPWCDAPFALGLEQPERRGLVPREPHQGRLLLLTLVDADTGLVRVLRTVSLSPAWCAALEGLLLEQAAAIQGFSPATHDMEIAQAYARWPQSRDAVRAALVMERAGAQATW